MKGLISRIVAVLLGLMCFNARATPSDVDALAFAKLAFANTVITCDSRAFVLTRGNVLTELHNPQYLVSHTELDAADRLNGIDYEGYVKLSFSAYREFSNSSYSWSEWEDPTSFASVLALGMESDVRHGEGPGTALGYGMPVEHKHGEWTPPGNVAKGARSFDCSVVKSIESTADKTNVVQLPGQIAQPFKATAVMNRDIPWLNKCSPTMGTRVMDLGPDHQLPDFQTIAVDPSVCPLKSRFATLGIVPADAMTPIGEWQDHPVASQNPPAQTTVSSPVARPDPVAPAVDPSHASLSHEQTRMFYTALSTPVFVRGYHGTVLCVVPARRAVPARVQSRPPQFNGDYGVLAYKADLCPNANSLPRDMYHEFFFRARAAP